VLSLPTGTAVTAEAIDEITRIIRFAVAHGPAIAARLGAVTVPAHPPRRGRPEAAPEGVNADTLDDPPRPR